MFDAPESTLYDSLNTVFENPKEYLADICFVYPSDDIWAHRALILARAPKEFIDQYLPELLEPKESPLRLNISHIIPHHLIIPLLRFWYTASYYNTVSPQSSLSDLSTIASPITDKDSAIALPSLSNYDIQKEIEQLGLELGTALLPPHCESIPDFVQLTSDLKRMRNEELATDVTINLISSKANNDNIPSILSTTPDNHTHEINVPIASFQAHRFILAAQSPYFYSLFCTQFQEASSSVVHFTDDLFNEAIIHVVLNFFYTDKIIVKPLPFNSTMTASRTQRRLQQHKYALRVIQKTFHSADFLGHIDTLGQALLHEMDTLCHGFKCVCSECAVLLPSMLAWSDKHAYMVPNLRRALILHYSDPVQSLSSLWSQRPFAFLITSLVPSSASLGEETLQAVNKQEPLFRARKPETLIHDIEERTFYNITKHNAIHVLHSLHLCLSQIRTVDPKPTWSRPSLDLINPILQYTVSMVSQFFDFYCVEYPILLSCVDGIGAGFSVDFLDFLLRHVLSEGIKDTNAGVIYQGIRRDLVGRQEVVKNMAIDEVLIKGRIRCAQYISKNWVNIKAQGGFRTLEKATLRQLAEDIDVPYRSLTKPFDDFANIFSFKPRRSKKYQEEYKSSSSFTSAYTRRLSLTHLMSQDNTRSQRPRALSTESVLVNLRRYRTAEQAIPPPTNNQPLIHLLSYETQERAKRLEGVNEVEDTVPNNDDSSNFRPMLRTSSSFTSLTDQLLPLDACFVEHHHQTPALSPSPSPSSDTTRPLRLKFELPSTPVRAKSPSKSNNGFLSPHSKQRRGSKSGRRSRWSIGSSSDVSDEEEIVQPVLGDKIELLRRPLPTLGTIKYIGPVQFAEGPYIGVELESRLGKTDGSVDGVRYFQTDPQRGLFVKPDDFIIINSQK
ncbi:uncharacterized protein BX663DRAFT_517153 [Cokeromyces recurvatus]|uniref:uncharacterized protein n=1 Tax=Cokeromyces recurvatus TaxID=90255 RepID=UPI00221FB933|nr:uncharacterized protein BX663DRAFT_517153 [Cokeromyces recurvatus]KAI7900659.1 hypothetical protein BX663DRAFT_517153 [Cokeromyces recurvatus]